ncbi:PepSY domain-containing protein [Paracidovorax cattleyae]|uniref:Peptidase propeptide and YPEB domain-containing protein n=1 Tax=Paracidovorax cattleyae TaxID=80868 RepID=A0A1H0WMV8_9BURK|nr:PepSY domain-containing protein [Paracidovorax cattleyae]AVS75398.1 PepSY domain-containing protein [Paracidovorax cattleyae]SDP92044.1 Peptidase propeptide and YPEB domain-containing protein [Paracidovorax cattleyae]
MNKKTLVTIALSAAAATALPSMAWALSAAEAVDVMARNQYVAPHDLQKQYGYWTASAVSSDGARATVLVKDADGSFTAVRRIDIGGALPGVEQVTQRLRATGYATVYDVELDDGFWEAKARQSTLQGEKVEFVLHPATLEVLSQVGRSGGTLNGQPVPGADQVRQALQVAGYTRIGDIDYDDGFWEAEATNAANQPVELRIEPTTGKVLREKLDD